MEDSVDFPIEGFDLKDYIVYDCDKKGISTVYDLFGTVNHFGNLNGGHYTAYGKNPDGKWYSYNDSFVQPMSSKNIVTGAAYILFYRRRDDPEKH